MTTAITDERAKELREWLNDAFDNYDYSEGGEQTPTSLLARTDLLAILDEHAALKAENERLEQENNYYEGRANELHGELFAMRDRAEKAEAELAALKAEVELQYQSRLTWQKLAETAEAELAAAKPLIEAAAHMASYDNPDYMHSELCEGTKGLLRAALALRQKKEGK